MTPSDQIPEGGERKARRCKPARGEAWGILNPWGDVWTTDTFATEAAARQHIEDFWSQPGFMPQDTGKFRVVRVKVTVSAKPTKAAQ